MHILNDMKDEAPASWQEIIKLIWDLLGKDKRRVIVASVIILAAYVWDLVPAFVLGRVVDGLTKHQSGEPYAFLYWYALLLALGGASVGLIRLRCKKALGESRNRTRYRARTEGFERMLLLSLSWHHEEHSGNRMQRITTGANSVAVALRIWQNGILRMSASVFGIIAVFAAFDSGAILLSVLYFIAFFLVHYRFAKRTAFLATRANKRQEHSSGTFFEGLGNMLSIKALGAGKAALQRIREAEIEALELQNKKIGLSIRKRGGYTILANLFQGLFLAYLVYRIIAGDLSVGLAFAFMSYFNKFQGMTEDMAEMGSDLIDIRADIGRMLPIFREVIAGEGGDLPFPRNWKTLSISGLSFSYPGKVERFRIENFDLSIRRNEHIGIVGNSGSGKSTIVRLLLGLYTPYSGKFRLDGTDLFTIRRDELLRNVSVVLQETELFNASLRENILFGTEASEESLTSAIRIAELDKLIERLPDGLETVLGEKGHSLSGGERQRVGIARAVIKNAPVLILDEATSSLDGATERAILKHLREGMKNTTMIVVTHRPLAMAELDRMIVMESGRIVEEGVFSTLSCDPRSKLASVYPHLRSFSHAN